ncbi:MAG TPA: pantetheine-phosphate adenylyltransferase [Ignavibacteria bacterium]|jgi:pantetheine-phosphate adenylyltransferase
MNKKTAIYPGTFDPLTFGHIDVLERAAKIFDKVIISVAESSSKKALFSIDERIELIKKAAVKLKNVEADFFNGLLVKYAEKKNAGVIIRGLRAISDFEYEFQMALTNRKISSKVETVFLMPNEKYSYISSTLVKEIAAYKGDISNFVPPSVAAKLKEKFGKSYK